jgi:hypothetical protein
MSGHVAPPRCVAHHVQGVQIDLQRARDREEEAERQARPRFYEPCPPKPWRRRSERGDRLDDEEQREVPFDDEQGVRGDDPRVVPELVREQCFADSADEEMKPDEERQAHAHGSVYAILVSPEVRCA